MGDKKRAAKKQNMKLWKKILIILLAIPVVLISVVALLYLYMDNAPSIGKNFIENIHTGGGIEQQYLQLGNCETSRITIKADAPNHGRRLNHQLCWWSELPPPGACCVSA